jgi:dehydrogenase/reductase SDR family protein 1
MDEKDADLTKRFRALGESLEFAGMAVAHLAQDSNMLEKTGRILMTCDLAREYGFEDVDGSIHDIRSISTLLGSSGHTWLAAVIPSFVRIPLTVVHYAGNKF